MPSRSPLIVRRLRSTAPKPADNGGSNKLLYEEIIAAVALIVLIVIGIFIYKSAGRKNGDGGETDNYD